MSKRKSEDKELVVQTVSLIDQSTLLERVSAIIENRQYRAQAQANQEIVLMFWEIGRYIGSVLLGGERAGYGKQIVDAGTTVTRKIWKKF